MIIAHKANYYSDIQFIWSMSAIFFLLSLFLKIFEICKVNHKLVISKTDQVYLSFTFFNLFCCTYNSNSCNVKKSLEFGGKLPKLIIYSIHLIIIISWICKTNNINSSDNHLTPPLPSFTILGPTY